MNRQKHVISRNVYGTSRKFLIQFAGKGHAIELLD